MFIPTVPPVPHTTILNKTIVYSDTVLTLKDLGKNLKITSIENVNEYSLESCLKTIFGSNPNVIFNTIQYSRNDEIVYFYTNKDITTKAYEERKFESYKPVNSNFSINIDPYCIEITDKYSKELLVANSYKHNYELKCNSSIVSEAFNGIESEIFKKIFIKISDCPKWSQATLYEMRQKQLAKEQKKK